MDGGGAPIMLSSCTGSYTRTMTGNPVGEYTIVGYRIGRKLSGWHPTFRRATPVSVSRKEGK
jgi:hypothetical protein